MPTQVSRDLRGVLRGFQPADETESADLARVRMLAGARANPWDRSLPLHLTASALVVHPPSGRVLLRWHQRQRAWLQVGGHGDAAETHPLAIALREAREETGLPDLQPWPDGRLSHLVIVPVPAGNGEPAHEHADVRFVLATRTPDAATPETRAAPLRWLVLADAMRVTSQDNLRESLRRLRPLIERSAATAP